ncbi:MAG TPA: zinc ribbon domain-containing protein, partial [Pseudomonadales bacterium]|nr:zinc ribbon domain-containing protein [Pseudomonadales bacterium]
MTEPSTTSCPTCRKPHAAGETVCDKCGTPLLGLCRACGAEVSGADTNCASCGARARRTSRRRGGALRRASRIGIVLAGIGLVAAAGAAVVWWQGGSGNESSSWAQLDRALTFFDS